MSTYLDASKAKARLQLLEVFQICDSTFPIGTFNHSFGLENYLFERRIQKAPEFDIWFKNYFSSQFLYGEGLLVCLCYQALDQQREADLLRYDRIMTMSTLAKETRAGTKLIAKQMLRLLEGIHGQSSVVADYQTAIREGKAFGNPAIAFALFAHSRQIDVMDAFLLYGYSIGSTMVQNAVRAIPLGQMEGQKILNRLNHQLIELWEIVANLDEFHLGANAPGIELSQMKHETQESRLFMS